MHGWGREVRDGEGGGWRRGREVCVCVCECIFLFFGWWGWAGGVVPVGGRPPGGEGGEGGEGVDARGGLEKEGCTHGNSWTGGGGGVPIAKSLVHTHKKIVTSRPHPLLYPMVTHWADLPPDLIGVLADALGGAPADVAAMRLVCRCVKRDGRQGAFLFFFFSGVPARPARQTRTACLRQPSTVQDGAKTMAPSN